MTTEYESLIASSRVSPQTRSVLLKRQMADDPNYLPKTLTAAQLSTLRAVLARVLPQEAEAPIDLGARIDTALTGAQGDGWRFAALPPDADAYRLGLDAIDQLAQKLRGEAFERLAPDAQDALIAAIADGRMRSPRIELQTWFLDLRAKAVEIFVGHPQTLAHMGYSGIADDPSGFVQIGMGKVEAWEPETR